MQIWLKSATATPNYPGYFPAQKNEYNRLYSVGNLWYQSALCSLQQK